MSANQLLPPPSGAPNPDLPRLAAPLPSPPALIPPPPPTAIDLRPAPPKRRQRWHVILGVVASVVVVSLFVGGLDGSLGAEKGEELPTFLGARPEYGTAVFTLDEVSGDSKSKATVTTGRDASVIHMVFSADSTSASVDMITDGVTVFAWTPESGQWVHNSFTAPEAFEVIAAMTKVATFDDWVPDVAKPFVVLVSKDERTLDGRSLTRYELVVHEAKFRKEEPQGYDAWVTRMSGKDGGDAQNSRIALSVDSFGVVRQFETWSDFNDDRATYTLVSLSPDDFEPPYPTSYFDMLHEGGPIQVGA